MALITVSVRDRLVDLCQLAPLHNPPSLEAIDAARAELPELPQIACFDTAFHRTMIPKAQRYAIPYEWSDQYAIRRYGFHGLSHSYCAARATKMLPSQEQPLRLVICHLGHGCSAAVVRGGKCIDTTMGFTPLEDLMMATRSGSLDPGQTAITAMAVPEPYILVRDGGKTKNVDGIELASGIGDRFPHVAQGFNRTGFQSDTESGCVMKDTWCRLSLIDSVCVGPLTANFMAYEGDDRCGG